MKLFIFYRQPQKAQRLQIERYLIVFIPLYVYRHRNNHNHHCESILHSVLSFVIDFGVVIRVEYLSSDVYGRIVASVRSALIIDVDPVSEKPP